MAECYLLQLSGQGLNLFLVRLLSLVSLERAGQRLEYALGTRVTYPGRITLSVTSSQYYSHSCLITSYLLFGHLEGLQVVADNSQLLLELHNLGLSGLGSLLSPLEISLNHGELSGHLRCNLRYNGMRYRSSLCFRQAQRTNKGDTEFENMHK